MKLKTKQITVTAIMLAICIISQFFKNLSVYITGPVINAALILTAIYAGLACGIILSIITPITSFFITGMPVMAAVPALFPCIIIGNVILVVMVALLRNKFCIFQCLIHRNLLDSLEIKDHNNQISDQYKSKHPCITQWLYAECEPSAV